MDWLFGTQDGFMAGGGVQGYLAKKEEFLKKSESKQK